MIGLEFGYWKSGKGGEKLGKWRWNCVGESRYRMIIYMPIGRDEMT